MEPPRTLPAWTYRSAAFFHAEKRAIWTREWLLAGHVSDLQRPRDFVSMTIAGEPVLAVRDQDGALRAFSSVCRHRGARVADRSGNCGKAFRCPHHGWTYGMDGRRPPKRVGRRDRLVRRLNVGINSLVQEEDNELTERVQEGLGSSLYRAGVLGARENGLKHFHDLIRAAIPAASLDDEPDGLAALAAQPVPVPT